MSIDLANAAVEDEPVEVVPIPKTLTRKISECDEFQLQECDGYENSKRIKCSQIEEDAVGEEEDDNQQGDDAENMRRFKESLLGSGNGREFAETYLVSNKTMMQNESSIPHQRQYKSQEQQLRQQQEKQKEPEDDFFIRDLDTGEVFDLRVSNEAGKFDYSLISLAGGNTSSISTNTQIGNGNISNIQQLDDGWKPFWQKVKRNNLLLLDYCELGNLPKLAALLDKANAIPTQVNFQGIDDWTGLHFAASMSHADIVGFLLQNGANPSMVSQMKRTALHSAVIVGSLECAKHLVSSGGRVLVDMQDKDFNTALHLATENDSEQLVLFLLQSGANTQLKNHKNLTPYQLCSSHEVKEIYHSHDTSNSYSAQSDYGRLSVGGVIKRNSRSDQVAKLLHLAKSAQKCAEQRKADLLHQKQKMIKEMNWTDFKYIKRLGSGSFGDVYLVERDKQRYAMKVQVKEKVFAKTLQRYVQTEKNALSLFNHPFIIKLHFAFQNEYYLFLVMELAEGGDMGEFLNRRNKLPEEEARIYTAQIVLALEVLHKHDIIFRDLKPDNVVLDKNGNAKLTDFGLSKEGITSDTYTKSFCGSVAYLAPEILTKRPHSRTVDWYLLGTFLYELLVGIPPYYDNKREILFENIKKGPLKIPKSMSSDAKDLIKQLLNRNPKERLGAKNDAMDIKTHPFFEGLDWEDVFTGKIKNPYVPVVDIPKQALVIQKEVEPPLQVNFDRNQTSQKQKSPNMKPATTASQPQEKIEKWTFIS